jgi:hypothetical protein
MALLVSPPRADYSVMAGLVPAIHVFALFSGSEDVDARHKAGHDERGVYHRANFRNGRQSHHASRPPEGSPEYSFWLGPTF